MKNHFLISSIALTMVAMTSFARFEPVGMMPQKNILDMGLNKSMKDTARPLHLKTVGKVKAKTEGQTNFKVRIPADNKNFEFSGITIAGSGGVHELDLSEFEHGTTEYDLYIAPGNYLMIASFWINSKEADLPRMAIVFKENVHVGEAAEISFDPEEATNRIHFEPINTHGKSVSLPIYTTLDEEPYYHYDFTNANATDMGWDSTIFHEEYGILHTLSTNGTSSGAESNGDFLTNPVGEKFHFISGVFVREGTITDAYNTNSVLYFVMGKKGNMDKYIVVRNNPDEFIPVAEKFTQTPAAEEEKVNGINSSVSFNLIINGKAEGGWSTNMTLKEPAANVYIQKDMTMAPLNATASVALQSIDIARSVIIEDFPWPMTTILGIKSNPLVYSDGKWLYTFNSNRSGNYSFTVKNDKEVAPLFPGNPAFETSKENLGVVLGNTAPVFSIMNQVIEYPAGTYHMHTPYYHGIGGEDRFIDESFAKIIVKRDGSTILEGGTTELLDWEQENVEDGHAKGIVELTFENRNILVDNLPGYNLASIKYDERKEDRNVPTIQKLWYRNSEGKITDRFEKAEDGVMEFSGADFNFNYNPEGYSWYNCDPVEVKVEYAPHNTVGWNKLEVEEVRENFYTPGFGYFWRAPLRQVNAKSKNGWFDLRISLTDPSGNNQTQTFGPAFFIADKTSGVEDINDTGARVYVDGRQIRCENSTERMIVKVYSLDGTLVCDKSDLSDLRPGIFIASVQINGEKKILKINLQ